MKYILTLLIFSIGLFNLYAQTNVSGGIYSNTTWTAVSSPYIVVDTVAVFPGVTLTIEPGVEVKFEDNKRLEIRQARLVAIGTQTDSITFTSNSQNPSSGIWGEIVFNDCTDTSYFDYCHISYAEDGIYFESDKSLIIRNSVFDFNETGLTLFYNGGRAEAYVDNSVFRNNLVNGIFGQLEGHVINCDFLSNENGIMETNTWEGLVQHCLFEANTNVGVHASHIVMDSCVISENRIGYEGAGGLEGYISNTVVSNNLEIGLLIAEESLTNCQILGNQIGIQNWGGPGSSNDYGLIEVYGNIIEANEIGIKLYQSNNGPSMIYCNSICNNQTYGLEYLIEFGDNFIAENNYWCSQDSTLISSLIYDGYDNINLGLVDFVPFDNASCSPVLGIENTIPGQSAAFFPNPFTEMVYWNSNETISNVEIVDLSGRMIYSMTNPSKKGLNLDHLNSGFYVIRLLKDGEVLGSEKLLKL